MGKIRVGVVRGGLSDEHDISLQTGEAVLKHLPQSKYIPVDVVLDKYKVWHENGEAKEAHYILQDIDVAFNALHGYYGEDGGVQKEYLESFDVPYTGSGVFASALGMNKALAKQKFKDVHLKTPHWKVLDREDADEGHIATLYRNFPQPSVVKPVDGGSSINVFITRDYSSFREAIESVLRKSRSVLIEDMIQGREATCGVIQDFRLQKEYALPPIEIIPQENHPFFNYDAKYSGGTQEICPGNFSINEKRMLMNMAVLAHQAIGARHYSRSDFIVSSRGIYILEINTLPGLTPESLLPKSLRAVGFEFPDFLDHIIKLALTSES